MPKYNREKRRRGEYAEEAFRESVVGANRQAGAAEHGLGAGLVKILAIPGLRP